MLFDSFHIWYMVISFILTASLLFLFSKVIKSENKQTLTLRIIAILVVLIHYSELWVNFLSVGEATVEPPLLFPIYPCNVIMWLLLLTSFITKKNTVFYKILTEFVAIAGLVCGLIGIVLNANYNNGGLDSYEIFSGLFSHSVMILGCLYLFQTAKVKIHVFNTISIACGLIFFLIDGVIINTIFYWCGLESPNSMYLAEIPFPELPWLTVPFIGFVAILLIFAVSSIVELITKKKEDRWYMKIRNLFHKINNTKNEITAENADN